MGIKPDIVLIAGPTASGKSAAALEAALRWDGVVINADSMQVYDALWVLTARPDGDDLALAEHRLYGHIAADQPYSVAAWLGEASTELRQLHQAGRTAVICGGTGLYFKALEEGISAVPAIDPDVRARWRSVAETQSGQLHEALARRDPPGAAALAPGDTQRLVRALEVLESTGRPLRAWQQDDARTGNVAPVLSDDMVIERRLIMPERSQLHARINARFDTMLEQGAIDEVRGLDERGLAADLPVMKAIGVREIAAHLKGDLTLAEAGERAKAASRQYAKRQMTWFRNQCGPEWVVEAV